MSALRTMPVRLDHRSSAAVAALCCVVVGWSSTALAEGTLSPEDLSFFESRIRPVLVERCYSCHSQAALSKNELQGGLLLDSRDGLARGGDSGPAITPRDPGTSLLLESLRYESFEMPPDGKLPEPVIRDFAAWIERGAPDPRSADGPIPPRGIDVVAGRSHWAYQPLTVPPPRPDGLAAGQSPIDWYLERGLAAAGLTPLPAADRVTLARRLSFDLTGLPPTPEQIDAFVNDAAPQAYERYVESLLASPQFGVRWGRHWLDVVRFAESVTLRGLVQHQAWRYRDYVVETFNADRPFNQFLREQVAGDLLPGGTLEERQRRCIATGFLTLTDANLEEQDKEQLRMDVVDEQLGVIGEAILGQTIGCARCHDHKFDPIPTTDYYALAGILHNTRTMEHANVSRWIERPLPATPEQEQQFAAAQERLAQAQGELTRLKSIGKPKLSRVVTSSALPGIVVDDQQAVFVGSWKHSVSVRPYIDAGYHHDENAAQGAKSATFRLSPPADDEYDIRLAYTTGTNRSRHVQVTVRTDAGEKPVVVDQRQPPPEDGLFVSLGRQMLGAGEAVEVVVSNAGSNGVVVVDAVQLLSDDDRRSQEAATPVENSMEDAEMLRTRTARVPALETEVRDLQRQLAARDLYQGVQEEAQPGDLRVRIRGNVHNEGAIALRGFLQVVSSASAAPLPVDQSGRVQLGDWLADPVNPLPARVYANRVWHWLFGAGLVATPDNFGTTGQPPSHPELLDDLAGRFVTSGWSTKSLIRELVLSDAYRRQSVASPAHLAVDPENRLLWRMNRKRLDAECLLDAVLSVSGRLDETIGGSTLPADLSADYSFLQGGDRRALYWPQFRNTRPRMLAVFDGANPSLVTGRRSAGSVAPQALYLLNDPWIIARSADAAERLLAIDGLSDSLRVQEAFRWVIGRRPSDAEEQAALAFVAGPGDDGAESDAVRRWAHCVQSLMCSLEFRFLP